MIADELVAIVVQKYGGSSVADLENIARVAGVVARTRQAGQDVVVVVSAMGKSTDNLLALARNMTALAKNDADPRMVEPPRRELDMLLSTGERVTMALLSIALHARGIDAISFTGSQSGIITNDRHFDARIIEVKPHRIEDELARGRIVIVAGYQGMSYRREVTTLGRGGSDTTAVALTAALGAERCEIYSDVDGVYSADPHSVADARHLPEVDYAIMQQMAESGAKVMHARAVEWAEKHRITIHARKTSDFARAGSGAETRIQRTSALGSAAIVVDRKLARVTAPASAAPALLAVLERLAAPVRELVVGAHLTLLLSLNALPDFARVEAELLALGADVRTGVGSVSVIGVGIGEDTERLRRVMTEFGSATELTLCSPLRLGLLLAERDISNAERRLHELYVTERD
jgi:aspartate kinase